MEGKPIKLNSGSPNPNTIPNHETFVEYVLNKLPDIFARWLDIDDVNRRLNTLPLDS